MHYWDYNVRRTDLLLISYEWFYANIHHLALLAFSEMHATTIINLVSICGHIIHHGFFNGYTWFTTKAMVTLEKCRCFFFLGRVVDLGVVKKPLAFLFSFRSFLFWTVWTIDVWSECNYDCHSSSAIQSRSSSYFSSCSRLKINGSSKSIPSRNARYDSSSHCSGTPRDGPFHSLPALLVE